MSAAVGVGGIKKVKKVTKTSKKGDGESSIETTTTTITTESATEDSKIRGTGGEFLNGSTDGTLSYSKERELEYEVLFCHHCDDSLAGHRYVLREDHPYCIRCYETVFANNCDECGKVIGIDSKDLSYKEKHWHENCFQCTKCRTSLVDKQFGSKADRIYCGSCYDAQFAARCDSCKDVFKAGMKKMEYKTRQWHEKCFVCCICNNTIGTKSFIPKENDIYCTSCYEDKFATKCIKCNKVITSGGVTYRNDPYHRECFTCTNCDRILAGQRFTSRDDKPFCADCFAQLFSKRCNACSKPITGKGGLGSTKFVAFETLSWHNECFFCAQCKVSMVGKGFIQDGENIICPECARNNMEQDMD